jgi:hypothetical protein
MKKLLLILLSISVNAVAMRDDTNANDPSSEVSATKSLSAASRPRRIEGDYSSRAGYSPYSTSSQLRIEQMLDPDIRPSPGDSVISVEDAVNQSRAGIGARPR